MTPFRYEKIGEELFQKLENHARQRDSVVLLGPRHMGKSFALTKLGNNLSKTGVKIGFVRFLQYEIVSSEETKLSFHASPWQDLDSGIVSLRPDPEAVVSWIDENSTEDRGVTLLATNVDAIPHVKAQEFLLNLRTRIESKGISARRPFVVLTGEADFKDLVYGPNSPFNCTNQYVIQGFAQKQFDEFLKPWIPDLSTLGGLKDDLFRLTGGNIYILRILLFCAFERGALTGKPPFGSETCPRFPVIHSYTISCILTGLGTRDI